MKPYLNSNSRSDLVRHFSILKSCFRLMQEMHRETNEDSYLSADFVMQMLENIEVCKELWEEIRADALDLGYEVDDPVLQIKRVEFLL